MTKRPFGLFYYYKNKQCIDLAKAVIDFLNKNQIPFYAIAGSDLELEQEQKLKSNKMAELVKFIIVIGGDGSILRAARFCAKHNAVLVGLHGGTKGFLTQLDKHNWQAGLRRLLAEDYTIEKRLMLRATISEEHKKDRHFLALNDAVIKVSSISRIMNFALHVNDSFVDNYPADGFLISTPTGSTAYSLSAGGPLVQPDHELLLALPVCTHRLRSRPFIFKVKDKIAISIKPHSDFIESKVNLTLDGQESYPLTKNSIVKVTAANNRVKMALLYERDFFQTLRSKID